MAEEHGPDSPLTTPNQTLNTVNTHHFRHEFQKQVTNFQQSTGSGFGLHQSPEHFDLLLSPSLAHTTNIRD